MFGFGANRTNPSRSAPIINTIIGVLVGIALIISGGRELLGWWSGHQRRVRVRGVFVGRQDVGGQRASVVSRAGRFRFTTREGHIVEAVSSLSTFPGPKPGKPVVISYDPVDPPGSAEVLSVFRSKVVISPLLIIGGAVLAIYSLTLF